MACRRSANGSSCATFSENSSSATASSQEPIRLITARWPVSVSGHGPPGAGTGPPTVS